MLFLGQASTYTARDVIRQLFMKGTNKDIDELRTYLAQRYQVPEGQTYLTINGRSAITLALKALVPEGSDVIINGFTCFAVTEAVRAAGCHEIYADIERETLNFGVKTLAKLKNNSKIKAIIIQNTLGIPVDIEAILKFAHKNKLVVIEDMAHCVGMHYENGREIGTVSDAAAFTFGKGKQIDATTGGALVLPKKPLQTIDAPTKSPKKSDNLRARIYPLLATMGRFCSRLHFGNPYYGLMIRLGAIVRANDVGVQLETRLASWQARRVLELFKKLDDTPIRKHYLVKNRAEVLKKLRKNGYFFNEIWFDVPVAPVRYYKQANFDEKACPTAVKVAQEIINLPAYYPEADLKRAYEIIEEYKI